MVWKMYQPKPVKIPSSSTAIDLKNLFLSAQFSACFTMHGCDVNARSNYNCGFLIFISTVKHYLNKMWRNTCAHFFPRWRRSLYFRPCESREFRQGTHDQVSNYCSGVTIAGYDLTRAVPWWMESSSKKSLTGANRGNHGESLHCGR